MDILNNLLVNNSAEMGLDLTIITIVVALLFGVMISYTYYKTQDETTYQRSLALTLLMLPVILAVIIVFVGSNIARAFSLAGTLAIIRFRSAPGDAKDITLIFFDVAAGLACGVGLYGYGFIFVAVLCIVFFVAEKAKLFEKKVDVKTLKITIPEDLNYEGVFEDILEKYTLKHTLTKIKTTELGALFELCYTLSMKSNINEHEFLNDIRCRNGNLNIILASVPKTTK